MYIELLNKGQVGVNHFVLCREVVCSPDTNCRKMNILELWSVFFGERIFPLYPPLGGSFIGGVPLYMDYWHNIREFNDMHCFIFGILVGVVAWKGMMVIQSVSIIMLSINEQYTIIQYMAYSSLLALNRHYTIIQCMPLNILNLTQQTVTDTILLWSTIHYINTVFILN